MEERQPPPSLLNGAVLVRRWKPRVTVDAGDAQQPPRIKQLKVGGASRSGGLRQSQKISKLPSCSVSQASCPPSSLEKTRSSSTSSDIKGDVAQRQKRTLLDAFFKVDEATKKAKIVPSNQSHKTNSETLAGAEKKRQHRGSENSGTASLSNIHVQEREDVSCHDDSKPRGILDSCKTSKVSGGTDACVGRLAENQFLGSEERQLFAKTSASLLTRPDTLSQGSLKVDRDGNGRAPTDLSAGDRASSVEDRGCRPIGPEAEDSLTDQQTFRASVPERPSGRSAKSHSSGRRDDAETAGAPGPAESLSRVVTSAEAATGTSRNSCTADSMSSGIIDSDRGRTVAQAGRSVPGKNSSATSPSSTSCIFPLSTASEEMGAKVRAPSPSALSCLRRRRRGLLAESSRPRREALSGTRERGRLHVGRSLTGRLLVRGQSFLDAYLRRLPTRSAASSPATSVAASRHASLLTGAPSSGFQRGILSAAAASPALMQGQYSREAAPHLASHAIRLDSRGRPPPPPPPSPSSTGGALRELSLEVCNGANRVNGAVAAAGTGKAPNVKAIGKVGLSWKKENLPPVPQPNVSPKKSANAPIQQAKDSLPDPTRAEAGDASKAGPPAPLGDSAKLESQKRAQTHVQAPMTPKTRHKGTHAAGGGTKTRTPVGEPRAAPRVSALVFFSDESPSYPPDFGIDNSHNCLWSRTEFDQGILKADVFHPGAYICESPRLSLGTSHFFLTRGHTGFHDFLA